MDRHPIALSLHVGTQTVWWETCPGVIPAEVLKTAASIRTESTVPNKGKANSFSLCSRTEGKKVNSPSVYTL